VERCLACEADGEQRADRGSDERELLPAARESFLDTMTHTDRRSFLLTCAGLFGIAVLPPELRGASRDENELSVDFSAPGQRIPENFLGLSFETAGLLSGEIFSSANQSLISLIRGLGPKGVIRIGGNSSDRPSLRKGLAWNRAPIEQLSGFLSATGWQLIYGLDLGSGKAEQAAAEAEIVAQVVGSNLLAFQFGNEPDLFRLNVRKPNYGVSDYIGEWREFLTALKARVPDAPLAGPDIANDTSWLGPFIDAFGSELVFLTCHYYSEGPASRSDVTMERMLDSGGVLANIIDSVAGRTAGSELKVRMAETNSVYGGGKLGISDTLGAALWGVDVMFTLAQAGWLGVNFHGGDAGPYSPTARSSSGVFEPRPLYYAMLLFAYAGRGSLVPIHGQGIRQSLGAFAVRGTGDERRVVLVNKDPAKDAHVRIAAIGQKATILRLAAPSADSKTDITFGGASVDPNGDWAPKLKESVTLESNRFLLELPPASAAVVQIQT
jgi:glycosyl hydrolase family 79